MRNTVMYMLEENVLRFPAKKALADEFRSLTYRDYLSLAVSAAEKILEQISSVPRPQGAEPEAEGKDTARTALPSGPGAQTSRPVGVLIDRSVLSIAAFMGIAYSGNFYVPLDPALPAGRLSIILQELSPAMLVDARETPGELPIPCDAPVLTMRDLLADLPCTDQSGGRMEAGEVPAGGTEKVPAEGTGARIPGLQPQQRPSAECAEDRLVERARALRRGIIDTDPLYAIFTSGSTGIPKGVLVPHRSVLDLVEAFAEVFGFREDSVFGNQAPFDFDVSVKDIYNALHCGGCVEVIPHRMFVMPALLMEHLAQRGVNTIIWAVSALRIVSDLRALEAVKTSLPLRFRHVMFSGEVMPVKSVNYWIRFFPDAVFVNLYGPTEITCNCTYHILDRAYRPDEMLPIGQAFPNTRVFLLETADPAERPASLPGAGESEEKTARTGFPRIITPAQPGVRGEICVEGTGVSLGYWNNPSRTAESFTEKPGAPASLNRIYRTGDLGYYNEDGDLFFAARADNQIKHMGHRIELGEIEAALSAIRFIDVACCFYDEKKEKIICVYQAKEEQKRAIIAALSDRLPKYMRPNKYLRMDRLPLNAHAKIDRRLLRSMYDGGRI